jgi:uncharacterized protein (DUF488 family)
LEIATMQLRVFTIGHSTRPSDEFVGMLKAHGVRWLGDVRKVPRSGHNPQFEGQALAATLRAQGIEYRHLPGLGGLRRPLRDSINLGWRNASFRGYADYMQTAEFHHSLDQLLELATERPTAIMCAEAVPWRCHRSLIADALLVRGVDVEEIVSAQKITPLAMHTFARVEGISITYPKDPAQGELGLEAVS